MIGVRVRQQDGVELGKLGQSNAWRAYPPQKFAESWIEVRIGEYAPLAQRD